MRYDPILKPNGEPSGSLCMFCRNSVPNPRVRKGCSWSVDFVPVSGWEAVATTIHISANKKAKGYCVTKCPQFVGDRLYDEEDIAFSRFVWEEEDEAV